MKTLYVHTDTTRFHTDKATGEEPRLVRLSWALGDNEPVVFLIEPIVGQTFDPRAVDHHGITETMAHNGTLLDLVIPIFLYQFDEADRIAAFNMEFHRRQLRRSIMPPGYGSQLPWVCPMEAARSLCKLPGRRPGSVGLKNPTLWEAYGLIVGSASGSSLTLSDNPLDSGRQIIDAVRRLDKAIYGRVA